MNMMIIIPPLNEVASNPLFNYFYNLLCIKINFIKSLVTYSIKFSRIKLILYLITKNIKFVSKFLLFAEKNFKDIF